MTFTAACPRCGSFIPKEAMEGEMMVVAPDGEIKWVQRHFFGECPKHGQVQVRRLPGHHSTLGEKELRRRYDKATRKRVVLRLSGRDRTKFQRALHGKHKPAPDEVALWDRLAVRPVPSARSGWMGRFHLGAPADGE